MRRRRQPTCHRAGHQHVLLCRQLWRALVAQRHAAPCAQATCAAPLRSRLCSRLPLLRPLPVPPLLLLLLLRWLRPGRRRRAATQRKALQALAQRGIAPRQQRLLLRGAKGAPGGR